jgi:hypothetical protein
VLLRLDAEGGIKLVKVGRDYIVRVTTLGPWFVFAPDSGLKWDWARVLTNWVRAGRLSGQMAGRFSRTTYSVGCWFVVVPEHASRTAGIQGLKPKL